MQAYFFATWVTFEFKPMSRAFWKVHSTDFWMSKVWLCFVFLPQLILTGEKIYKENEAFPPLPLWDTLDRFSKGWFISTSYNLLFQRLEACIHYPDKYLKIDTIGLTQGTIDNVAQWAHGQVGTELGMLWIQRLPEHWAGTLSHRFKSDNWLHSRVFQTSIR